MICDHCNFKVCHNYCLENPIEWIPEEDFYCNECCTRFNLKNEFAPPQQFNAELYEQIVGQGAPEQEPRRRDEPTRMMTRTRRMRLNQDDEEFGTYHPRRRHFRFRNGDRQNLDRSNRQRTTGDILTQPQDTNPQMSSSRFNTRDSESSSFSEEEPIHINKVSRSDRLRQRQAQMESIRGQGGIKYKPSPVKKEPKDLRGQWRRIRRIREAARELDQDSSWRLFDKKDISSHENVSSLLELAKSSSEFVDPVERHKRLESGMEKPRFYDRKTKMAVETLPLAESDDEWQEDEEFSEEEQSDDEVSLHSENSSDSEQLEDSRFEEESSESFVSSKELEDESNGDSDFKHITRNNKPISKTRRIPHKLAIPKSLPVKKRGVIAKKFHEKKVAYKKTPFIQNHLPPAKISRVKSIQQEPIAKRQPKKVIDFDFDNSGKKVVIIEQTPKINKNNLTEMPRVKVAGKKQDQKKQRSVSKSAPKSKEIKRSVSRKQNKGKTTSKTPKIAKEKQAANSRGKSKSAIKTTSKTTKATRKTQARGSESPIKGGIGNIFQVDHRVLKPLSKKEQKSHHDEHLAIRKIAEIEDAKEKKGKFKFGFMKGPKQNPVQKVPRERSREMEKYVKGQPIRHSTMALSNLSLLTYKD